MKKEITIGLFGFGVVGSGLYEVLHQSKFIQASIKRIVVKNPAKERSLDSNLFSYDPEALLNDPEINVVVELINDAEAAYHLVTSALKKGKHVVSANKKLIAHHLEELIHLAQENEVSFLYEAAVAGSIPIIRNLEEYYNTDSIKSVQGILNGTCNYILSKCNKGMTYQEALREAQEKGFAEADPRMDVEGLDAGFKLSILLKHSFGISVPPDKIYTKGINSIKQSDLHYAAEQGFQIKLLARAEKRGYEITAFVAPHFVSNEHFAYHVNEEFNTVQVEALFCDKQQFIGKGAGSHPTASAVLSDISALVYDYRYEYRKNARHVSLTSDALVLVYVSADDSELLLQLPFEERINQKFTVQGNYVVGSIPLSELRSMSPELSKQLSIVFFTNPLFLTESGDRRQQEAEILQATV